MYGVGLCYLVPGAAVEGPGALRLVVNLPCLMACLWLVSVAQDVRCVA